MSDRDIDKAKSLAAIFGGLAAIAAGIAGAEGYALPAVIAGGFLIIAGIGLAIATGGRTDAH